jgi:hypothetical protein
MHGDIPPLLQHVSMARCLVKHRDFTFTFYLYQPTNSTVNNLPCKTDNDSASLEIPRCYETQNFITVFEKSINPVAFIYIYIKHILILSLHLRVAPLSDFITSGFRQKFCKHL